MRINSKRLYPYPVLWFVNDDYLNSDNSFNCKFNSDQTHDELFLDFSFELQNEELKQLIEQGKAMYAIHLECALTMFRQNYTSDNPRYKISVPSESINHKIEVIPLIVATELLKDFRNKFLNEDYHNVSLSIQEGSILAIGDQSSFYVDKEKDELGKKESIFSIIKNLSNEPMQIEIEMDRIQIKLNEEDFGNFQILQMNSRNQAVIFSMLIIPALIFALDEISKAESSEELESFRNYIWFRSLEKCFVSMKMKLDNNTITQKTSYTLAQMLLKNPISKAFTYLNQREDA